MATQRNIVYLSIASRNTIFSKFLRLCIYFSIGLRTSQRICPPEVIRFLLDLFKYNDNSRNHYSDNYYRANLIDALGYTITPVVSVIQHGTPITAENLSADAK